MAPAAFAMRVAAPLCCITVVEPVQVATRSLTWTWKPSLPILDFASLALMVASISASLNLPSLCDLVSGGPANRDSVHPSSAKAGKAVFIPAQCVPDREIRKENARRLIFVRRACRTLGPLLFARLRCDRVSLELGND